MPRQSSKPAFVLLLVASVALWIRPLVSTMTLAWTDERYSHILLILPVVAVLLAQAWRDLEAHEGNRSAVLLIAFSLLLGAFAMWGNFSEGSGLPLTISMVGLVLWWIGSLAYCVGFTGLRAALFPALFSFWIVPIPAAVLDRIVILLQQGSAIAAQSLFWMARVPVSRQDVILFIPGVEIEVATECSSIRSSMILVVVTMLLAQLLLRSPWRKLIVMAASLPLSIAKNSLRIFVIAMLGTRVDESYWTGSFHHHGGIVFFLIALAAIFFLIWIFRRGEAKGAWPRSTQTHS